MNSLLVRIHCNLAAVAVLVFAFASCSPAVSYHRQVAAIPTQVNGTPVETDVIGKLKAARRTADAMVAAGYFFDVASLSYADAVAGDEMALALYNHAVGRLVEVLDEESGIPWDGMLEIGDGDSPRMLDARMESAVRSGDRRIAVVDGLVFRGRYGRTQATRDGIGAPVVAVVASSFDHRERFEKGQSYVSLTAVLTFDNDRRARLELLDPLEHERVAILGENPVLAANFTAPVALALAETRIDRLGLARLFNVRKFSRDVSLIRLQHYDKDRIPVLMVHGLQDTPATWMPMYQHLFSDPQIRDHFQFWVFSYPSGLPYPHTAAMLRNELDGVRKAFPDHKDLVLIGHSMGGIISRLMVTDAGDRIWKEIFGASPDDLDIPGRSRELLLDALVFDKRDEVDRAIFIATPHRGSMLAASWIGRTASRLVRLPTYITDIRHDLTSVISADVAGIQLNFTPNSIDTLNPNNRFVRKVNNIPVHRNVPFHSIIGDRGRGDTPDSSDGVVAYWSSHMAGAASEKIVPSGHGAHQHPDAIQEVKRILKAHLEGYR